MQVVELERASIQFLEVTSLCRGSGRLWLRVTSAIACVSKVSVNSNSLDSREELSENVSTVQSNSTDVEDLLDSVEVEGSAFVH